MAQERAASLWFEITFAERIFEAAALSDDSAAASRQEV